MQTIIYFYCDNNQRETPLVLAQVLKKFLTAAANAHLNAQVLHKLLGSENNSVQKAFVLVSGSQTMEFLKPWLGTIRWIGNSKFSKIEKETSWFVGVQIWNEKANFVFEINDVSFQTMRSSGPGGQHVNKVSTAVRAIHEPTGVQVSASDSRSQLKNKELALARLEEKVNLFQMSQLLKTIKNSAISVLPLNENRPTKTFRGSDFKKESNKNPVKKERQSSKIDIKKNYYDDND